ncbi:dual specificity protein kinase splA-like [Penaeus japonicus]|uniref:dual specificity protein kinase splA-like n=1 Tax=Penaeus japonicus TaxID=27405 RepID=UPI001C70B7D7|nr:dual specificity protein kinase splA-like [Penaeus japonicus]
MSVGSMDVLKFSSTLVLLLASMAAGDAAAPPGIPSSQRKDLLASRELHEPATIPIGTKYNTLNGFSRLATIHANEVGDDQGRALPDRAPTEHPVEGFNREAQPDAGRSRAGRFLPMGLLGSPPPSPSQTPLMVAQANNQDYQYMPLQDDGTVYVLDPCPAPPPPSGGGGSNVFALLTFGVVTANVLINAVANVNSNNNNNNNNDNNNNDNINNENVSSNLDSNTNDNTIMGRALAANASLPNAPASCACSRRRRRAPSEVPEGLQTPRWLMSCVPRLVCESYRSAALSSGLASVAGKITGLTSSLIGLQQIAKDDLKKAQTRGSTGASCDLHYPCPALGQ